ncbi:anaphase-promoting complex subunit cdc27 [Coemansia nantahalensis]|uniref:Anaphase-promoting complex subunit cdc27 n=3 Tax=Coemansia TaxID=4863 RepID=A0ACC1K6E4_9FUNG|nr:anaphase-promoting complex subunit cdc27 [Coemansia nantahalensis]
MACTRLEKWQEAEDHLQTLTTALRQLYPPDEPGCAAGTDSRLLAAGVPGLYAPPTHADVSDLLALVCLRTNRAAQSEVHSADALHRNPLLWSSYRRLCELGASRRLTAVLDSAVELLPADRTPPPGQKAGLAAERTPAPPTRHTALSKKLGAALQQASGHRTRRTADTADTVSSIRTHARVSARPATPRAATTTNKVDNGGAGHGTGPAQRTLLGLKGGAAASGLAKGARVAAPLATKTPARPRADALVAKSEKKRARSGVAVRSLPATTLWSREGAAPAAPAAAASAAPPAGPSAGRDGQLPHDLQALQDIHQLLTQSALATAHMLSYRATQGLLAIAALPAKQRNTAWGLCMLGRVCFEAGRYPEAAQAFGEAHRLAPYRVRDMETYSTLLWHMKDEEALAQLAHSLVSIGRNWSPEAWVAVANCFSLDGDHQAALKSLGRSMQLYRSAHGGTAVVPRGDAGGIGGLAYAHTLAGHENVALDELDRAQQAFRTAIRIDPRHYNAWYGLGMSYLRLGKPDLAEYHFKRAIALNAQNPLLLQSAGAVFEHRKEYDRALGVYERVEAMLRDGRSASPAAAADGDGEGGDGRTAMVTDEGVVLGQLTHYAMNFVMFKHARVLVVLERFGEAAEILEQLLRRCPREFNVPFLLGQTYAKLRRHREASACLTRALDIGPENMLSVREAFDALYLQDAEDQEAGPGDADNGENSPAHAATDSMCTPSGGLAPGEDILSPGSSAGSPYMDSPSLHAGRRARAAWRDDWRALGSADDRVDRALDFDIQ